MARADGIYIEYSEQTISVAGHWTVMRQGGRVIGVILETDLKNGRVNLQGRVRMDALDGDVLIGNFDRVDVALEAIINTLDAIDRTGGA